MMDETESEANSAKLMTTENYKHYRACITAFASGTGLAGIVGYGYKALISDLLGWSLSACVWSAVVFPLAYYFIYRNGVHNIELSMQQIITSSDLGQSRSLYHGLGRDRNTSNGNPVSTVLEMVDSELVYPEQRQHVQTNRAFTPHNLTSYERCKLVLSLWKYTIPLFTVYAAEYMLQAGVWPSIGFPVTSASARAQFYQYSNWSVR
jgi:battenin